MKRERKFVKNIENILELCLIWFLLLLLDSRMKTYILIFTINGYFILVYCFVNSSFRANHFKSENIHTDLDIGLPCMISTTFSLILYVGL